MRGGAGVRRAVRDDQHATQTGYAYGCRLPCCTEAHRLYALERRALGLDRRPNDRRPFNVAAPVRHDDAIDTLLEILHGPRA